MSAPVIPLVTENYILRGFREMTMAERQDFAMSEGTCYAGLANAAVKAGKCVKRPLQ